MIPSHRERPVTSKSAPAPSKFCPTATLIVVVFAMLVVSQSEVAAAVFGNFDASRHSRFLADGSPNSGFLIDESSLSGVGVNSQTVLISPQHILTAQHFPDSTPTFRGGDGVTRTYSTSGFVDLTTHLGVSSFTSDIRLYTLTEAIPIEHDVRPVALFNDDPANLLAQEFYLFAQGNRAGTNVIDAVTPATLAGTESLTQTIFYTFDTDTNGGSNATADEAGLLPGDSGSAALIQVGDEIALLGTHLGISVPSGNNPSDRDLYFNFSTLVTTYISEIESVVAADGQSISTVSFSSVVAVPEPSSLAGLFTMLLLMHRRKRS